MRRLWPSTLVCIAVVVALSVALATIAGERFVGRAEQLGVIGGDVLFSDDFSGDLSQWSDAVGTCSIDSGELLGRGAGGGTDGWLYAGDTDWTDYAVQAKVEFAGSEASFVLRSTGHWKNEYRIDLWAQSSSVHPNRIGVTKYAEGVSTLLPEDYSLSPVPITDISFVRLEVVGNNIDIYINDQFVLRITDQDALPSGRIGLGIIWGLRVRFDDVIVTSLGTPTMSSPGGMGFIPSQPGKYPKITSPPVQTLSELPNNVDLSENLPPVGNQGQTGTCAAWAISYYYKTYQQKAEHGYILDNAGEPIYERIFSPSFVYNQIADDSSCKSGIALGQALSLIAGQGTHYSNGYGDLPWSQFPWNSADCSVLPNNAQMQEALNYTAEGYGELVHNEWSWEDNGNQPSFPPYTNDLALIRAQLANNNPVVFGLPVYSEFVSAWCDDSVSPPYDTSTFLGLHAVLAVGYDDYFASTGAFKIVNSWGRDRGCDGFVYLSYDFVRSYLIEAWTMTDRTDGPLPSPTDEDDSELVAHITMPLGANVSPGQSLIKTWRVRNSGTTTWGNGYQLVFVGGDQMSAPNAVDVPVTAPNATADLSVNVTAPAEPGSYRGYWRMQNPQGTYFGDQLYVDITVPGATDDPLPDTPAIELRCLDCPASLPPGESFRPTIRAIVNSGVLLESRGDMLRLSSGEAYGAFQHVAMTGSVYAGQTHDFTFYADNPITAPDAEGTYESQWRIWRDGAWSGETLTIRFEVRSASVRNHAPNAPTLTGPGDWAVYKGSSGINLTAAANGDTDGDAITAYYFEIFESAQNTNSGWISADHWSPQGLGFNNYQWHAKVRDSAGNESDWSQVWHFTVENDATTIYSFYSINCGSIGGDPDKVCFCADTNAGTLKLQINTATDGSSSGEWEGINELGVPDYPCTSVDDNPPNLDPLPYGAGTHVVRLYVRGEGGWENATHSDITLSLPPNRKPNMPHIEQPEHDAYLPSRTVRFDWAPTLRTTSYRLQVSTDNARQNLVLDRTLSASVTEYVYTLTDDYDFLYLRVIATGPYGSNQADSHFHIDIDPPSSSIVGLPGTKTDTRFAVSWGGSDARSGLRWYHLQVRQSDRADSAWEDWLADTAETAAIFQAQPGHRYCFRVRAMDETGNWEAWPSGEGDTCTLVDPSAMATETWWDTDYAHKRNLVILNNDSHTMPAGFPVSVHFDASTSPTAAEIYNALADQSAGKDLRVTYNDTTELPRYMQRLSSSNIDLWFPLQNALGGKTNADGLYQIYYGRDVGSLGTPPQSINDVFMPKVDSNTMGLWHFFEGGGSSVQDTSGRSHNGTFYSANWADGYLGYAGRFNGTDAYVNLGNHSDFNVRAMTIEAWVYLTDSPRDYPHVISKWGGAGSAYFLRIMGDGTVQFQTTADGGNRDVGSSEKLQLNRWYHIAGVHDGGSNMWVYVNGEERGHNGDSRTPNTTSEPLKIGRDPNWSGSAFPGHIQHVRVSNITRRDFPYAKADIAPSVAAGVAVDRPIGGEADLALVSLTAYPSMEGGQVLQAVVKNQGTIPTQNEFYTDLYADHVPTGAGDYTGSVRFWVNAPIASGAQVTLTTAVTDAAGLAASTQTLAAPGDEVLMTFYAQVDSVGRIEEPDNTNNISPGTQVCLASPDAYEADDTKGEASWLQEGAAQQHNFDRLTDQDWFKFTALAGLTYTISTSELGSASDTYLYLYDRDGTTLLSANDDYVGELSSAVELAAEESSTYYILVKHWNPNIGGCGTGYTISVTESNTPGTLLPVKIFLPTVLKAYTPPLSTYTLTVYAALSDVEIARLGCSTWAECKAATQSNYLLRDYPRGSITSGYDAGKYSIKRLLLDFDTSQLPDNAQVLDATLHFYSEYWLEGSTRVHVVRARHGIPAAVGDLNSVGTTPAGSVVATRNSWTAISLDDVGRSWVAVDGRTKLALTHDLDLTNTAPTEPNGVVVAMAESGNGPYLEIRYTFPAAQ